MKLKRMLVALAVAVPLAVVGIAFAANVPIHELTADTSSLEEAFLGLTADQAA